MKGSQCRACGGDGDNLGSVRSTACRSRSIRKTTSKLLRIISPSTVNLHSATGTVVNPYPDPKPYYDSLAKTKNKTTLHGTYGGAKPAVKPLPANAYVTQDYLFTATVAKSGDVILKGSGTANMNTGTTGQSAVGAQTITIKAAQQRVGFYGLAPDYYLASYQSGSQSRQ